MNDLLRSSYVATDNAFVPKLSGDCRSFPFSFFSSKEYRCQSSFQQHLQIESAILRHCSNIVIWTGERHDIAILSALLVMNKLVIRTCGVENDLAPLFTLSRKVPTSARASPASSVVCVDPNVNVNINPTSIGLSILLSCGGKQDCVLQGITGKQNRDAVQAVQIKTRISKARPKTARPLALKRGTG